MNAHEIREQIQAALGSGEAHDMAAGFNDRTWQEYVAEVQRGEATVIEVAGRITAEAEAERAAQWQFEYDVYTR